MRIVILILMLGGTLSTAAEPTTNTLLPIMRIYTGEDGRTHFAEGAMVLEVENFSAQTPPFAVSQRLSATDIAFATMPPGWFGDWHPAPRRQYVLMLQGQFEIETGDGEIRRFNAGETFLVEDTSGPGHRTRVISEEPVVLAMVPTGF
mgnify:CR=1 FL=1